MRELAIINVGRGVPAAVAATAVAVAVGAAVTREAAADTTHEHNARAPPGAAEGERVHFPGFLPRRRGRCRKERRRRETRLVVAVAQTATRATSPIETDPVLKNAGIAITLFRTTGMAAPLQPGTIAASPTTLMLTFHVVLDPEDVRHRRFIREGVETASALQQHQTLLTAVEGMPTRYQGGALTRDRDDQGGKCGSKMDQGRAIKSTIARTLEVGKASSRWCTVDADGVTMAGDGADEAMNKKRKGRPNRRICPPPLRLLPRLASPPPLLRLPLPPPLPAI